MGMKSIGLFIVCLVSFPAVVIRGSDGRLQGKGVLTDPSDSKPVHSSQLHQQMEMVYGSEFMTSLPPKIRDAFSRCLIMKGFHVALSEDNYALKNMYMECLELMHSFYPVMRRHLADQPQSPTPAFAPVPVPSPASTLSPHARVKQTTTSKTQLKSRVLLSGVQPKLHKERTPKKLPEDKTKSIVMAVVLSSSGTFLLFLGVFCCFWKYSRRNQYSVHGRYQRPLWKLGELSGSTIKSQTSHAFSTDDSFNGTSAADKLPGYHNSSIASFELKDGSESKILLPPPPGRGSVSTVSLPPMPSAAPPATTDVLPITSAAAPPATTDVLPNTSAAAPPATTDVLPRTSAAVTPATTGAHPTTPDVPTATTAVLPTMPVVPPPRTVVLPTTLAAAAAPPPPPPPLPMSLPELLPLPPTPPPPPPPPSSRRRRPPPPSPPPTALPPSPTAAAPDPPPPLNKSAPPPPPRPPTQNSKHGDPPPPPPKAGIRRSQVSSNTTRSPNRKAKLKPFFWDKVLASPDQSSVWHQIRVGSFQLDEDMIESLFGYNAAKNSSQRKKGSSSSEHSIHYIQLLDPKKSQNLAISLRALNVKKEEVHEALMEGNELPTALLQTLLKMQPTSEEELKIRLYTGDVSLLGPAEQFLKHLIDIPFLFKRMDVLLFMSSLHEDVSSIKDSFATLEAACEELKNHRLFLKLLEAVLKTGNRMNDGTYRGGAQAFKLDTLLKLSDVKGIDGKTTLLIFVVQEIIRSEGRRAARLAKESKNSCNLLNSSFGSIDILEDCRSETGDRYLDLGLKLVSSLSSDLVNVKKAAVVEFDAITSTVANFGRKIVEIKQFLSTDMANIEEDSGFHHLLKCFVEHAEAAITFLLEEERRIKASVQKTVDYFHGSAGKDEGLRLFVVVRDFLGMLDKACKEAKAQLKVQNAQKVKDSSSSNPIPDSRQHLFPATKDRRVENSGSSSNEEP